VTPVNLGPNNATPASQSQKAGQQARGAAPPQPAAAQNGASDQTMTAGAYAKP
jgi:hypothetical protein